MIESCRTTPLMGTAGSTRRSYVAPDRAAIQRILLAQPWKEPENIFRVASQAARKKQSVAKSAKLFYICSRSAFVKQTVELSGSIEIAPPVDPRSRPIDARHEAGALKTRRGEPPVDPLNCGASAAGAVARRAVAVERRRHFFLTWIARNPLKSHNRTKESKKIQARFLGPAWTGFGSAWRNLARGVTAASIRALRWRPFSRSRESALRRAGPHPALSRKGRRETPVSRRAMRERQIRRLTS